MSIFPGTALFSSPPRPKELPPPPKREDPGVTNARNQARAALKRRKGRRSTILTSGRGAEEPSLGNNASPASGGASVLG